MGKYYKKFKKKVSGIDGKLAGLNTKKGTIPPNQNIKDLSADAFTDPEEKSLLEEIEALEKAEKEGKKENLFDEPNIKAGQKPESFHHFILENQYQDLERSIRGFKDVYDKNSRTWAIRRKEEHCFTDEEAEEILRTAQSHLATDIKLSYLSKESFPLMMDALYKQLSFLFRSIAEYRYGRFKTYEKQYEMKAENLKIFIELMARVQANYSRAIQGMENKSTHGSIKTQESLQGGMNLDNPLAGLRRWS